MLPPLGRIHLDFLLINSIPGNNLVNILPNRSIQINTQISGNLLPLPTILATTVTAASEVWWKPSTWKVKKNQAKEKDEVRFTCSEKSIEGMPNSAPSGSCNGATDKVEKYVEVICYNCGEPGYHVVASYFPKTFFIYISLDHEVDICPVKKQLQ
jgi:hypothetical protein